MKSAKREKQERMASRFRRRMLFAALALLCAGLALLLCACGGGHVDKNYPYEPDTPAPSPHEGTFVSEHGKMVFNGDGHSVLLDLDGDLAQRLGLPAGEQAASYEFRSGDLPPHGYVPTRYDAAMTFWLTVGEGDGAVTVMVEVGKYEDGRFYTGTNCTEADRITFFVERPDGGNREAVDFLKY